MRTQESDHYYDDESLEGNKSKNVFGLMIQKLEWISVCVCVEYVLLVYGYDGDSCCVLDGENGCKESLNSIEEYKEKYEIHTD